MGCIKDKMFPDVEIDEVENEEELEECCLNCVHYRPAEAVECTPWAKKHDRTSLEIDCPDTLRCGFYDSKKKA
jgi:hypothetical protein